MVLRFQASGKLGRKRLFATSSGDDGDVSLTHKLSFLSTFQFEGRWRDLV
jgi:hypothetical protein